MGIFLLILSVFFYVVVFKQFDHHSSLFFVSWLNQLFIMISAIIAIIESRIFSIRIPSERLVLILRIGLIVLCLGFYVYTKLKSYTPQVEINL